MNPIPENIMTNKISHEAITASAGSGKTFQLAHRYIRLLASGVKPDRIIALTFSRKAAGEIFDSIIKYLRLAASSESEAQATAEIIGLPALCQADFLKLLRDMLNSLHRLHISTLDSFTIGVIRAFPMELGIPSGFQVMESDGALARTARQEILSRLFNNSYVDRTAQKEFLEAFKQATYGQEEKGLQRSLDTFISEYRTYYQILPAQNAWGDSDRIWPQGSLWLKNVGDINPIATDLEALLIHDDLSENTMNRWHIFIEAVRDFNVHSNWSRDIEYLAEKLLEDVEGLRRGNAHLKIDRAKCELSDDESRLALELLTHIMKTELTAALEKTRGIYRVLNQYEQFYENQVRRQGKLTFNDVQYLLTPANIDSGGCLLSRIVDEDSRLYIDYRLDCKLDHWLLDEFQDTSDLQWEALRNLADEILQDTSGERSFFYVGDVKQAIYGWRGGNAQLFGKILEQYGDLIRQRPLNTSFRSSPPIIDTVNQVFTQLPPELPAEAISQWEGIWQEHHCQEGFVPIEGYAALLEPLYEGSEKPGEEDRYRVVARLLNEIDPLHRGLSTAILVRSNESGRRLVNYLRSECPNMTIVHEGRAAIKDNPVVALLLSLVKFAAHPGDTFAWRHLQMSPLSRYLAHKRLNRGNLSHTLLREMQTNGFQDFIRNWGKLLNAMYPLDDFGQKRLNDLIEAAGEFDNSNKPDSNAFLHFIDNYQIHELASEDVIRVMTIHQSKGLGFDIVILPDLQGKSMTSAGEIGFTTARDPATNQPVWALKMPRRLISQNDPTLASQINASDEASCFDALCVLYVALTRAKQGLYMVTSYPGKTAKTITPATLLKTRLCNDPKPTDGPPVSIDGEQFTCLFETGQRDWHTRVSREETSMPLPATPELSGDFHKKSSQRVRMTRISPSEQVGYTQNAGYLFSDAYYRSLEFGSAIHELFRKVSWIDKADIEGIIRQRQGKSAFEDEFNQRMAEHFRQALTSEEVRQVLSHPDGNAELWREKRFEIVIENQWITGAFDRVVIIRDNEGKALQATIVDFKSDEVENDTILAQAAKGYRPQLALYGKALSLMLAIDRSQIELKVLFTNPGKVYNLE